MKTQTRDQDAEPHSGVVSCRRCLRTTESTLTWTREVGPRGDAWICDSCTRENIRAIEAELDDVWWE